MRKSTVALVSFVAGMLCSLMLGMLENQAWTVLQRSVFAQVKSTASIPVVPPLSGMVEENQLVEGGKVWLDGIQSKHNTFKNVVFEYGGGEYSLESVSITGQVGISLVGAARNTANFLSSFGLIGCPVAKPPTPRFNPNAPMTASLTAPIKGNLTSLKAQK